MTSNNMALYLLIEKCTYLLVLNNNMFHIRKAILSRILFQRDDKMCYKFNII